MTEKVILDLCGGTGAWSKPYKDNGYDVRVITLPEDIRLYCPSKKVYGVLAAPPCTMFSLAGNKYRFKEKQEGIYIPKILKALTLVDACFRIIALSSPKFWALENPVGTLSNYLGKPDFIFNPCDFGDSYTKKTALWGNFTPPLPLILGENRAVEPEFVYCGKENKRMSKQHYDAFRLPKEKRAEVRSITPLGFAQAFYEANK